MNDTPHTSLAVPTSADDAARRWKQGDRQAAREVWDLCGGRALRLARALTRSAMTAEDAVQEAFLRAWRHLPAYDPARPFEAWLTAIVVRECRRAAKKEARAARSLPPPGLQAPGGELFEAVGQLPHKLKEAVALHYLAGYNQQETARLLGVPEGTIKSRLHRARKTLAQLLNGGNP